MWCSCDWVCLQVEKAPVLVKAKLDKKSAEEIKEKLEKGGLHVVLNSYAWKM